LSSEKKKKKNGKKEWESEIKAENLILVSEPRRRSPIKKEEKRK